jgi:transcriptional regulator with XRE-family HTH domain
MIDMDEVNKAVVAIDGDAIRRIREEQRLTQLYVAKVVGVTTDTVSRWENNRYPSIKRDNALKLAEALDVDLKNILQDVSFLDDNSEIKASDTWQQKQKLWPYLLLSLLLLVIALIVYFVSFSMTPTMQASRVLPVYAAPGSQVLVQVHLTLDDSLQGVILRETLPHGWRLVDAFPAISGFDEKENVARWIFRSPTKQMQVFYVLEVPTTQPEIETIQFTGELVASAGEKRLLVDVDALGEMHVEPLHWVDTDGNHVIDDIEILNLSVLTENTGQLALGWDAIEELWQAGSYHWDEQNHRFVAGL